jgi:hypothetical protein
MNYKITRNIKLMKIICSCGTISEYSDEKDIAKIAESADNCKAYTLSECGHEVIFDTPPTYIRLTDTVEMRGKACVIYEEGQK